MKQESVDKLKQAMVSTYQRYGSDTACVIKGGRSYTGFEVAVEIENETDFGLSFLKSIMNLTVELIKKDRINVGCEDIDKRYDPTVDRNLTLNEYIGECYGGLPNESMLKEEWLRLPLTKSDYIIINDVKLYTNDVIQLTEPELFKEHLINERMAENEVKQQMQMEAKSELSLAWFVAHGLYTHELYPMIYNMKDYYFRITSITNDEIKVSLISTYNDENISKYFNTFDFKNAKFYKMGCNNNNV